MGIRLAPMSPDEYQKFYNKSLQEYAYNQVAVGNWRAQDAVSLARQELNEMLPQGLETPNAYLSNILNDTDVPIGMMWFYIDEGRPQKTAVLLDFFLFPAFRNQTLAMEVLSVFEKGVRAVGVSRVELQVFGHKSDEIRLYTENAYQQTMVLFAKDLVE